jgi:outer membrane protein assembly factor BamD
MLRFVLALVLLSTSGCAWLRAAPTPILPPEELYALGERKLEQRTYLDAREDFKKIVERHPNSSLAPRARFLIGEAYYREAEFDKAANAMSYYDQIKPVEQDQGLTVKALEQFRKLVKEYPESRYATEALAKIDVCRGRLAQKEVWVATYYFNQGNRSAARQRLELVLKEYPRTLVIPETLYVLAEVNFSEGRAQEGTELLRQLASEYGFTEWGRRAAQRLRAQR